MRRWPAARSTATEPSPASPRSMPARRRRRSPSARRIPASSCSSATTTGNTVTLGAANTYTGGTIDPRRQPHHRRRQLARRRRVPSRRNDRSRQYQDQRPGRQRHHLQQPDRRQRNADDRDHGRQRHCDVHDRRPIAVDGEAATINVNGYIVTLTGQLVSLGTDGVGLGNATGMSDLTIDDTQRPTRASLILSTASPNFYGNIIIGNSGAPTVRVMNDAALGNTTGCRRHRSAQVELNGGTLQAGASFAAPERNICSSAAAAAIDVNGFTTSWGTLTDAQRTLEILNSKRPRPAPSPSTISRSARTGDAATRRRRGGRNGDVDQRHQHARPAPRSSFSRRLRPRSGPHRKAVLRRRRGTQSPTASPRPGSSPTTASRTAAAPMISSPTAPTAMSRRPTAPTAVGAGDRHHGRRRDREARRWPPTPRAYALKIESGKTITLGSNTLTLGDGTNPAGLILGRGNADLRRNPGVRRQRSRDAGSAAPAPSIQRSPARAVSPSRAPAA